MSDGPAPRPRWQRLALLGALFYAACLVASAPAAVAGWLLARASGGVATLEQPEGSLWRGRAAALTVVVPGGARQRFDNIAWRLSAARLARAELGVGVSIDGTSGKASAVVVPRPRSLQFKGLVAKAPAPIIAGLLPALALAGLGGEVSAQSGELLIADDQLLGSAEIQWTNAATALSPISPLGTYRALVTGKGAAAEIKVSTEKGALQIDGSGAWSAAQGLRFAGEARPAEPQAAALAPLLKLFGPPDSRGVHVLTYALQPTRR